MAELTSMQNIGTEMARKLTAVGIDTPEKLTQLGSKHAYFKLKEVFPQICLVHLYALEGAIHHTAYNCLSKDTKRERSSSATSSRTNKKRLPPRTSGSLFLAYWASTSTLPNSRPL